MSHDGKEGASVSSPFYQSSKTARLALFAVLFSLGSHIFAYFAIDSLPNTNKNLENRVVTVSLKKPPPPPPPIVNEPKKEEPVVEPKKIKPPVKKTKVRADSRVKPPPPEAPPPPPQEVRGGLSDSTALKGTGAPTAPAIAEGNSAVVEVDPSKNVGTPPPPVAVVTAEPEIVENLAPVNELAAETPANCPAPPSLTLSEDALNAGLTSGEVVVEVNVDREGNPNGARLVKGTGFDIDKVVLEAAKKMSCTPAKMNGKSVAVKSKRLTWRIVAD